MINVDEIFGNGIERYVGVNTRFVILQVYFLYYVFILRVNCFIFILKLGISGICINIIYIYLLIVLVKYFYILVMYLYGLEKTIVSKFILVKFFVKLFLDNLQVIKRKF